MQKLDQSQANAFAQEGVLNAATVQKQSEANTRVIDTSESQVRRANQEQLDPYSHMFPQTAQHPDAHTEHMMVTGNQANQMQMLQFNLNSSSPFDPSMPIMNAHFLV